MMSINSEMTAASRPKSEGECCSPQPGFPSIYIATQIGCGKEVHFWGGTYRHIWKTVSNGQWIEKYVMLQDDPDGGTKKTCLR
jgi:hypothetical protein